MLMQWVWPEETASGIVQMLSWVCLHEYEQIQKPAPPVIGKKERRQLEAIFSTLDVENKGFCSAADIAMSNRHDVKAKLNCVIDERTVKAVCGPDGLTLLPFLEHMCEDGYRAHQQAGFAYSAGSPSTPPLKLVHLTRPASGFSGWVYEHPPREEVRQRMLVDAIEEEVLKWHEASESVTKQGSKESITKRGFKEKLGRERHRRASVSHA